MRQHRSARLAATLTALACATVGVTLVLPTVPAGAADQCLSVTFPATRLIDWDGFNPKVEFSPAVAAALAAGTYAVEGTSHDGYPSRTGVTQTSEIWELQFLDAAGTVVATSGLTGDLPDRTAVADWAGSLGTVTLAGPIVSVRAHHRPDAIADGSANSVVPVAATICPNGVGPSTTTAGSTTTLAPTTSTTVAPTSTAAPTTAPSTTATPTTTPPTTAPPTTAPATTAPVKVETTVAPPASVKAETTVVGATPTTPTGTGDELASTGSSSEPLGGVALVLFGLGVLMLGYKAQSIGRPTR